jgi:hypothetical protein
MTVKELIEHLNQFDSEAKVIFTHLDHTDWLYKVDMNEWDITSGDEEDDEDFYDENDNYIGPKVVEFGLSLDVYDENED